MHAMSGNQALVGGDANKIFTILSIVFNEQAGNPEKVHMYIDAGYNDVAGVSGQNIYLLNRADIGARGTFVWNDKFVVYGLDVLKAEVYLGGDVDVLVSYIEQDWS